MSDAERGPQRLKCLVWDLDNTLWQGVLLEGDPVELRPGAPEAVRELDRRGILQSVASKNDEAEAMATLEAFGLTEYFLYPQIHWETKSESIKRIADCLNVGTNAIGFIDDDEFERAEVGFAHPDVLCLDAASLPRLLEMPELKPRFVTEESAMRRSLYMADMRRKEFQSDFSGTEAEFLATLDMRFTIQPAGAGDLERAEELAERTHQLNSTGYTYSYQELCALRTSPRHRLLTATLVDRFGSYGTIGLALIELSRGVWTLKLLLASCRVMSRGVGGVMLTYVMQAARHCGVSLRAEFMPTDRNRLMNVTFRLAGFREVERCGECVLLESDLERVPVFPRWVRVWCSGLSTGAPLPEDRRG